MDPHVVDAHGEHIVIRRRLSIAFAALSIFFYLFIFLIPVLTVVAKGVEAWTSASKAILDSLWPIIRFTYLQAFVSALLSGAVGVPLAFWLHDRSERWARTLWYSTLLPFSVPGILYALSFIGFWGERGPAKAFLAALGFGPLWESPFGLIPILVAHTFMNFPVYVRWVGVALDRDGESLERAALALGASRLDCLGRVTLPKIRSALSGSFLLAFLYSASSFVLIMFLGGNPRYTTLEVALYESIRMWFDLPRASIIALCQLSVFGFIFLLIAWPRRRVASEKRIVSRLPSIYRPRTWLGETVGWSFLSLFVFFVFLAPLFHLVVAAIPGFSVFTVGEWFRLVWRSLTVALGTAAAAIVMSFGLAYAAARSSRKRIKLLFEGMASLPLAVSTLIFGLGILLFYPRRDLGILPICLVQAVGCLPLTFRAWQQGLKRIPEELRQTAASLGAGDWTVFLRVEMPLLRSAAGLAFALAVSFSLAEMGSLLLFYSAGMETLSMEMYRRMARYDFDGAYAVGAVLLTSVLVVNWFAGWMEEKLA